jgi:hypothetical protein
LIFFSAWELYERVLQAACDCGRPDIALACAHPLVKKFGRGSLRVRNLIGQFMEADQNPQEAEKEYDAILKEDPTYAVCNQNDSFEMFWSFEAFVRFLCIFTV